MTAQAQQAPLKETQQLRTFSKKRNNREPCLRRSRSAEDVGSAALAQLPPLYHFKTSTFLFLSFHMERIISNFLISIFKFVLKIRTRFQSFSRRINFNLQI